MSNDSDRLPWGSLLGDYFHVATTIAEMEAAFDDSYLEQNERYQRLLQGRQELRGQLDEASHHFRDSDIKEALDAAFADSRETPD